MPHALIVFGNTCSGKTTYALEQMMTGEWDGIVSEDKICDKIMNVMGQKDYYETKGASQVKTIYYKRINYNYLHEQLLALSILKFGYDKNLIFEGYSLNSQEDRKVVYNVLKILGYTNATLIEMPSKKDLGNTEFLSHEVVSYQTVKMNPVPPPRHEEAFYVSWRKAVIRMGDI